MYGIGTASQLAQTQITNEQNEPNKTILKKFINKL